LDDEAQGELHMVLRVAAGWRHYTARKAANGGQPQLRRGTACNERRDCSMYVKQVTKNKVLLSFAAGSLHHAVTAWA
jgi:hypothetical protein